LFAALAPARRVLLAGAGGGFDVYAALVGLCPPGLPILES
jgi:hypothetical protein